MVAVPVHNLGSIGFIPDLPTTEIPPEAWSDARNMRFKGNRALRSNGHSLVFDAPSVAPYWALFCPGISLNFWLYAGAAKVYVVDSANNHTNITRQSAGVDVDYSMDQELLWNGGILGGIPVINNGIDAPQFWATIDTGTKLADLTAWPANTTARIMRPFKGFLVALDITKVGTRYPHRVKWSHEADPGTIPTSWNETDPAVDAGEVDLTDVARGFIIDGRALGDLFMIYKQSSIWAMQFIGGQFIFRFAQVVEGIGAYSKHCIAQVGAKGQPRHFVFTGDDIVICDGQTADSILTDKARDWLKASMSSTKLNRAYCQTNYKDHECWFCFPSEGADWPDLALVWNWDNNTLVPRNIVESSYMAVGDTTQDTSVSTTWDTDSDTWDGDLTSWDAAAAAPNILKMLQCAPVLSKLYVADEGLTFDGSGFTSYLERQGLAIIGKDRNGSPKLDVTLRKFVSRIWPKATGGPITVRVGQQEDADAPVTWSDPQSFDPSMQKYLDFYVNGVLIAVRFEGPADSDWYLSGYDIEVSPGGNI